MRVREKKKEKEKDRQGKSSGREQKRSRQRSNIWQITDLGLAWQARMQKARLPACGELSNTNDMELVKALDANRLTFKHKLARLELAQLVTEIFSCFTLHKSATCLEHTGPGWPAG